MTKREAAFHWTINVTEAMPQTESEMAAQGALGILAAGYLLNVEKECHQALARLSELAPEQELRRTTEFRPLKSQRLRKKRLKTVTTILACSMFFEEIGSSAMVEMLGLLASLAVDGSTGELYRVVTPVVVEEARQPRSWSLLERVFPELCRLIEEDAAASALPDQVAKLASSAARPK